MNKEVFVIPYGHPRSDEDWQKLFPDRTVVRSERIPTYEAIVPESPRIRVKPNGTYTYVPIDHIAAHEWERCNPPRGSKVVDNSYGAIVVQKKDDDGI